MGFKDVSGMSVKSLRARERLDRRGRESCEDGWAGGWILGIGIMALRQPAWGFR